MFAAWFALAAAAAPRPVCLNGVLEGKVVETGTMDPQDVHDIRAGMGVHATVLARVGEAWRPVPEPDLVLIPERVRIELVAADSLQVTATLTRTPCTRAGSWGGATYIDVDAVVEVRLGEWVLERWERAGAAANWRGATAPGLVIGTGSRSRDPLVVERAGAEPGHVVPLELLHVREALLAALNRAPFDAWQVALMERLAASVAGSKDRARLLALVDDLDHAGPGLSGPAHAALRAIAQSRRLSSADLARLGPSALDGDKRHAGARFDTRADISWWVGGVAVESGGTAPVGGLVDLRWRTWMPGFGLRSDGHVLATLGPGVTVRYNDHLGPEVLPVPGLTCAHFEPAVEWHASGVATTSGVLPVAQLIRHPTSPTPGPTTITARTEDPYSPSLAQADVAPGLPGLYRYRLSTDRKRIEVGFEAGESRCAGVSVPPTPAYR